MPRNAAECASAAKCRGMPMNASECSGMLRNVCRGSKLQKSCQDVQSFDNWFRTISKGAKLFQTVLNSCERLKSSKLSPKLPREKMQRNAKELQWLSLCFLVVLFAKVIHFARNAAEFAWAIL